MEGNGLPTMTEMRTWSPYDLGRALHQLKSADMNLVRRTLRALLIRWWHSQAHDLIKVLHNAGVPVEVCSMAHDIVGTCRACRQWQSPAPNNMPTVRVSLTFNEYVQVDLLFVGELIVAHLIDKCLRFSGGGVT
eukprot:3265312-Pyramimonas_sp.AAC.1